MMDILKSNVFGEVNSKVTLFQEIHMKFRKIALLWNSPPHLVKTSFY